MDSRLVLNITQADIDGAINRYNRNPVAQCAQRMGYKGAYAGHRGWLVVPNKDRRVPAHLKNLRYYPLIGDETLQAFLTDFINDRAVEPTEITLYYERDRHV